MENNKPFVENKMGTMPINKLLLNMSLPLVISLLMQAMYNFVDSLYIARLGEEAFTAISLSLPMLTVMIGVGQGVGIGVNALLSRSLGEKNFDMVNKSAIHAIFLAICCSLIFVFVGIFCSDSFMMTQTNNEAIVEYGSIYLKCICIASLPLFLQLNFERLLMSTGMTVYMMISLLISAGLNIILAPFLIFGWLFFPKLGVLGAAIAAVFCQSIGASIGLYFNLKKNKEISFHIKGFRPSIRIIVEIFKVGIPSILLSTLGSLMSYGLNRILMGFSETAVAVFGVYYRVQSIAFMPIFGLNGAIVPIVAYNYGAQERRRILRAIKLSLGYASALLTFFMVIFLLFPKQIFQIFNASDYMLAIGVPALRIISIHFLFAGFVIIILSVCQALARGVESTIIAVIRQVALLLPIAWLLSKTGTLLYVWWAFPITEAITVIIALIVFVSLNKKIISKIPLKEKLPDRP